MDNFIIRPDYVSTNGPISYWTSTGCKGINPTIGDYSDNGVPPDGEHMAFLQTLSGPDSSLSHIIPGLKANTQYRLKYNYNARALTATPSY